jgi:hypothetical protein
MIAGVGKGYEQPRPAERSDSHPWVRSWPGWMALLVRDRDGKILGEKVSQDNSLRCLMPALLGRFPDRHGHASKVSAMVVGVDRCR